MGQLEIALGGSVKVDETLLQEALNMNFEEDWKVQKIASLLPRPLYLVYANLCAYSEPCDSQPSIAINGDEFDAKNLEEIDKFNSKIDMDDVPDSDNDDNDGENVSKTISKI
ncbi:hypothetical protein HA402_014790 [Bradysia odoriphaga]|nr:hypothetical protein HA402_014790 [Bradysia odoriphaga]